ncbi:MAG: hypothetical protein R3231_00170 [bacterium]|nr:hypothetical protein [bacterium]
MDLQGKLSAKKKEFERGAPPEKVAIMNRATEELQRSGIEAGVLKKGDRVPIIELPNEKGATVRSPALLEKGPLVIHFYRGVW